VTGRGQLLLLAQIFLVLVTAREGSAQWSREMLNLRQTYFAAVEDENAIARGLHALEQIRSSGAVPDAGAGTALLQAYEGALVTLRAKHAVWPPTRLRHLRDGLVLLDASVASEPDHPEIRYLRLLSCYYLPAILGRKESVREDFAVLSRVLPAARDAFPPELYRPMVVFVLDNGEMDARSRLALRRALENRPADE
jgi:hypothetical protein